MKKSRPTVKEKRESITITLPISQINWLNHYTRTRRRPLTPGTISESIELAIRDQIRQYRKIAKAKKATKPTKSAPKPKPLKTENENIKDLFGIKVS